LAVTVNATPGDSAANSYETVEEAATYFMTRGAGGVAPSQWTSLTDQGAQLVFATRVLNMMLRPQKTLIPAAGSVAAYYRIRRTWTGLPASSTQILAWPRTGMFDGNNNPIDPTTIPQDLKDALSELAYQLAIADRTLDNDTIVQGISSIRAGSVSLNFRAGLLPQVLPDAVLNLMPPSWFTDEKVRPAMPAFIDIFGHPHAEGHYEHDTGDSE
jgi:hypothetical protein